MRPFLAAAFLPLALSAQNCAPLGSLSPSATLSAALDDSACRQADGTLYAAYRLVLPTRGRIQLDLTASADFAILLRDAHDPLLGSGRSLARAIERGTYTVVVNARTTGQSGAFTLRTAFTPEPATLCRDYASIGPNSQVSGDLAGSGCRTPDGSPYEAWALHTLGSGELTLQADADGLTPSLILRDADGHALATADGAIAWAVDSDTDYLVVVTGNPAGAYRLTTTLDAGALDPCQAQAVFTGSDRHAGVINSTSKCSASTDGGDPVRYDYYGLNVGEAGTADLAVTSSAFDPTLDLRDSSGTQIASNQLAGGKGTSVIHLHLTPGNYVLRVVPAQPDGGAYVLQYTFSPGPAQNCPVLDYSAGDTVDANISASTCRSLFGLGDVYRVTLPVDGTLELSLNSFDFPAILALRDAKDNTVVWDDSSNGLGSSRIAADLGAGTYSIVASASLSAGAYELTSRFTPHALAACPAPQDIPPNTGYIQLLGLNPCHGGNGQPVDYYQFTLPADGTVAAVMTSGNIDSYLTVTDASGAFLRSDDNTFGNGDALLIQFLPAGTYKIAASAAETGFNGVYRVDVLFQAGPRPPGCAPRSTLSAGTPVTGNINYSGCQYTDDTFADLYQFELTDAATVELALDSSDFDAYLVLLDSQRNVVTEDDNGGSDTNAHILRPLPAGRYTVVAKPASDYGSNGDYQLSLSLK